MIDHTDPEIEHSPLTRDVMGLPSRSKFTDYKVPKEAGLLRWLIIKAHRPSGAIFSQQTETPMRNLNGRSPQKGLALS